MTTTTALSGAVSVSLADLYRLPASPERDHLIARTARIHNPHERQHEEYEYWLRRFHNALGAPISLEALSETNLHKARAYFARSPHENAWIWATLCGAEIERRTAAHTAVGVVDR